MKKFFLSKADTLISLKLKSAKIPKLIKINFKDYFSNKYHYLSKINKEFHNSKIVIRSSFSNEDTAKTYHKLNSFFLRINNKKIDMTSFLNSSIKQIKLKMKIKFYNSYWYEIDNDKDLLIAQKELKE